MKTRKLYLLFTSLIFTCTTLSVQANNKDLMPKGMYQSDDNLIWMRCAIGQTFKNNACVGEATTFTWFEAKQFAKKYTYLSEMGWRLPSIEELHGLVSCNQGFSDTIKIPTSFSKRKQVNNLCKQGSETPTINSKIFPNTSTDLFWSSTADPLQNGFAWYTYFGGGHSGIYNMKVKNQIRLVKTLKK